MSAPCPTDASNVRRPINTSLILKILRARQRSSVLGGALLELATGLALFLASLMVAGAGGAESMVDLSKAIIVSAADGPASERKAVQMLAEEVGKRTRLRWAHQPFWPTSGVPVIVVGNATSLQSFAQSRGTQIVARNTREGYRIWTEGATPPVVWVVGDDSRGVLFGVGRLLRTLQLEPQTISLAAGFRADTAPQMPLRGHQLGYRPKCNSYDGWTVAMWEQYIRDLVVFGCNAIELIPPGSDDADDSPHFPLPKMEMMVEMSRLADEYGLDVWIWYPAMDADYADPRTVEFALKEWGEVFRQLPRIDAVFVPGGDPGHTQPKVLFELLEKQTTNLHRFHPKAQMWMSPQSFNATWMQEFFELIRREPAWLSGVVYGPQVRISLPELRAGIPARYSIRDYPDITHSRHCQYPVPDWELAFAMTEGREPINPRPQAMATIYQLTHTNTTGFITYSEGCNDDVNKVVWSALGWNREANLTEVLREYGRYFIGATRADRFAEGLLMLEKNWQGPLRRNEQVEKTLSHFQALEREATPQEKLNWRFQQALYRAYYDAYLCRRLIYESGLEEQARAKLGDTAGVGSLAAMSSAGKILERAVAEPVAAELRARVVELAEALFQSIRMQLSVAKYQAITMDRGANLDAIDVPLNSRAWLKKRFAAIAVLDTEGGRFAQIKEIVEWKNPGPGGFYDDLGNPEQQPHLVRGTGGSDDPAFLQSSLASFIRDPRPEWPVSWWHWAEALYDRPLQLRYTGLDPTAQYKVRVVYGRESRAAKIRLMANESTEVHSFLTKPFERLEYDLPHASTRSGHLTLSWTQEPGAGGNGRGCQVAEVWLIKRPDR